MNNIGVHNFLQDHNFTKSCARPPAIGEENDVVSVDGRQSTHSSISGKSEVSTATPRRNDMDLGFEPEGSASPMIPCEKWRLSLRNVLEDNEGIKLFREFVTNDDKEKLLDCWLACKGFKDFGVKNGCSNSSSPAGGTTTQQSTSDMETHSKRCKLAKKIFFEYLKKDKPACYVVASIISDGTRQSICRQIKKGSQSQSPERHQIAIGSSLFNDAQNEIEHHIETNIYPNFIKSELFFNHSLRHDGKHAKQATASSASSQSDTTDSPSQQQAINTPNMMGRYGYLPRLDEDAVWDPNIPVVAGSGAQAPNLTTRVVSASVQPSLARTAMERNMLASQAQNPGTSHGSDQSNPAYPYYAAPSAPKYYVPPASANASDNASSDATSDTLSCTDGSIDLEVGATYSAKKLQKRIVRHQAKRNHAMYNAGEEFFVPMTRRCQYKQDLATLATVNPEGFFSQLKVKLEKVAEERRRKEILEDSQLDNVDDILDNHIERVMKTPNPLESPSRNSPPPIRNGSYPHSSQTRATNFQIPQTQDTVHKKAVRGHNAIIPQHGHKPQQIDFMRRMEMTRKWREIPIGMTPNEVPDVPDMPAQPVDKRELVHEWIKQQGSVSEPLSPLQKKGSLPKAGKYINPRDNFPMQCPASKAYPYHGRSRLQPTSQDVNMPPLPRPDPGTMLDEVKRRLIAETESKYDSPLNLALPVIGAVSGSLPILRNGVELQKTQIPGISSSNSSAVAVNVEANSTSVEAKTTCLYQLPNEEMWYKTHFLGNEITLERFKNSIQRKGSFKYYFKQYSKEWNGPVFFEIKDNNEILPLWEKSVVAKIKEDNT